MAITYANYERYINIYVATVQHLYVKSLHIYIQAQRNAKLPNDNLNEVKAIYFTSQSNRRCTSLFVYLCHRASSDWGSSRPTGGLTWGQGMDETNGRQNDVSLAYQKWNVADTQKLINALSVTSPFTSGCGLLRPDSGVCVCVFERVCVCRGRRMCVCLCVCV